MNFNNKGYSTQGYINEIPLVVQLMISSMLHKRIEEKKEVDYMKHGFIKAAAVTPDVKVADVDIATLQRTLVANKCNIGQGYREIPSLEKGVDYSEYAVEVAKRRNGWEFEALLKKN